MSGDISGGHMEPSKAIEGPINHQHNEEHEELPGGLKFQEDRVVKDLNNDWSATVGRSMLKKAQKVKIGEETVTLNPKRIKEVAGDLQLLEKNKTPVAYGTNGVFNNAYASAIKQKLPNPYRYADIIANYASVKEFAKIAPEQNN